MAALGERRGLRIAGLYDEAEERFFARGLERAGLGPVPDRGRLEQLGFFACVTDLEDELIRAVGERRMLEVIDEHGELASFRILQRQPAQRTWSLHQQLRRFVSARSGHKSRYAPRARRGPRPRRDPATPGAGAHVGYDHISAGHPCKIRPIQPPVLTRPES